MVSNLDLLDFSSRIWGVINGLCCRAEQRTDLRGACFSRVVERTELNRVR